MALEIALEVIHVKSVRAQAALSRGGREVNGVHSGLVSVRMASIAARVDAMAVRPFGLRPCLARAVAGWIH
jgi:hypothetical protein